MPPYRLQYALNLISPLHIRISYPKRYAPQLPHIHILSTPKGKEKKHMSTMIRSHAENIELAMFTMYIRQEKQTVGIWRN